MDLDQHHRDFVQNANENFRNKQLTSSIYQLARTQSESNAILMQQCVALQKRNEMLESELKNSRSQARKAMIFNIISASIAFASLIATILIAVFANR